MSLTITEKQPDGGVYILEMNGFVDMSTSGILESAIKKLFDAEKTKVVIDLGGVGFISSAGWSTIMAYLKRMHDNRGDIRLAAMTEKVDKVFKIMEFDGIIDSFVTVEEAVNSYK